jgi:hypothetical protein
LTNNRWALGAQPTGRLRNTRSSATEVDLNGKHGVLLIWIRGMDEPPRSSAHRRRLVWGRLQGFQKTRFSNFQHSAQSRVVQFQSGDLIAQLVILGLERLDLSRLITTLCPSSAFLLYDNRCGC